MALARREPLIPPLFPAKAKMRIISKTNNSKKMIIPPNRSNTKSTTIIISHVGPEMLKLAILIASAPRLGL